MLLRQVHWQRNVPGGAPGGTALDVTAIPALLTSMSIGDEFRSSIAETEVIARIGVPVLAPIAGAGLPGLILASGPARLVATAAEERLNIRQAFCASPFGFLLMWS
jgi:hypothetical protein